MLITRWQMLSIDRISLNTAEFKEKLEQLSCFYTGTGACRNWPQAKIIRPQGFGATDESPLPSCVNCLLARRFFAEQPLINPSGCKHADMVPNFPSLPGAVAQWAGKQHSQELLWFRLEGYDHKSWQRGCLGNKWIVITISTLRKTWYMGDKWDELMVNETVKAALLVCLLLTYSKA